MRPARAALGFARPSPSSASKASTDTAAPPPAAKRRARRRKRRSPPDAAASPEDVVARATRADKLRGPTTAPAEQPLSPEEVALYRQHFRFLREHRKLLKLRLNAQEDLLINAAREPEHRGICQRLLSKVEYSRVSAAAPALDAASRRRLLEGLLAFTHELPYVLLYLETLRDTAHQDASSALLTALAAIDFKEVSEGQMRRVLELVVETFPEGRYAPVLFDLFRSASFRRAFEATHSKLPDALLAALRPVQAVSAYAAKGRVSDERADEVVVGLRWLLPDASAFGRWPAIVRERLIRRALELTLAPAERATIDQLLRSNTGAELRQLGLTWVRWLLSTGEHDAAVRQLEVLSTQRGVSPQQAARFDHWRRALNSKHRVGSFALLAPPAPSSTPKTSRSENARPPRASRCIEAVWLTTLQDAWLRLGIPGDEEDAFERLRELHRRCWVPSVSTCVDVGESEWGPYYAVLRRGELLSRKRCRVAAPFERLAWAKEGTLLLLGLGRCGVVLADVSCRRFEIDPTGRLWLSDLRGSEIAADPLDAQQRCFALALQWCEQLLGDVLRSAAQVSTRLGDYADAEALLARLTEASLQPSWLPPLEAANS